MAFDDIIWKLRSELSTVTRPMVSLNFRTRNNPFYYIFKSLRAVIGQFSGPYSPARPLKFLLLPNCCVIYRVMILTHTRSKGLKHSSTPDCALKRANELKTISNWLVLFSACFRNLKPFLVNGNRSWTRQSHNRDIINILLTSSSRSLL